MDKDRAERFVIGSLMVVSGYLFVYELKFVAFLMGLMLLGFTVDPRGVQDDFPAKAAAPKKAAPKAKSRKRK